MKSVETSQGASIIVDSALAKSKNVAIVAVANAGNFSSKVLDERNVTAIVNQESGKKVISVEEIQNALTSAGISNDQGTVIVRSGKQRRVQSHGSNALEVVANGDLEADHVLHLLGHAKDECRASMQKTKELLESFVKGATSVHSRFHTEKKGEDPAVQHSSGAHAYKNAKEVAERDLPEAIKAAGETKDGDMVYSVHYSDINGLSRLENYILAGEISRYLGEFDITELHNGEC